MRVGLVGAGRIGSSHARVVRSHPDVNELTLCDIDAARAKSLGEELGAGWTTNLDELVERSDAVLVTSSTAAHPEHVIAAVEAGLPVFCEKPVAPDVTSTLQVADAVRAAGVPVQVGFQRRFDTGYGAARAALQRGDLGELHRVHVLTADQAPPHADYIPLSGGIFRDCHVHDFDILRWVTGREVVEVYAAGANRGADFFAAAGDVDESAAVLTLDDGTLVTLQGSRYNGGGHDVRMELAGTRTSWSVGLDERTPLVSAQPGVEFPGGDPWPNFWVRFEPCYRAEVGAFLELAQGRRDIACTVEEALEAFLVAEAATVSRHEHRPVRVAEVRP